jgi:choline dehydrogenase-like flavoprotein
MQSDFSTAGEGARYDCDLCIVGSGAAGIAIAVELADSGLDILLLESGGLDPGSATDALSEGSHEGFPFKGLTEGRARAFGGATRLWFGQCIRLDNIDYERRPWVDRSGWPFGPETLDPYYARAERMMGLDDPIYDTAIWKRFGVPDPEFSPNLIVPKFTIYCRQPDFKARYAKQLRAAANVRLLLNATAIEIDTNASATQVESVQIRSLSGASGVVRAKSYVICGGGIENARLLLSSRATVAGGLGNERDLVGRFLQDHPSGRTAKIAIEAPKPLQEQFSILHRRGLRFWPKLALSPKLQRERELLNGNAYPVYDYPEWSSAHGLKTLIAGVRAKRLTADILRSVANILADTPRLLGQALRFANTGRAPTFPPSRVWIQAFTEQAPDPDNRVTLSSVKDAFGMPQPLVRWRLGDLERRTLLATTEAVATEFQRLGLGNTETASWLLGPPDELAGHIGDAFHHAGTTRMALSATEGVVDTDCRVNEVNNLFIAGSSVFPTSGYANPTLTIIALALRLSDHLKSKLGASR